MIIVHKLDKFRSRKATESASYFQIQLNPNVHIKVVYLKL